MTNSSQHGQVLLLAASPNLRWEKLTKNDNGIPLTCTKCDPVYSWNYAGDLPAGSFCSCPRCHTNVRIVRPAEFYPREIEGVKEFLTFWESHPLRPAGGSNVGFDGFLLADEYKKIVEELAALRKLTLRFIAPVTDPLYPSVLENTILRADIDADFREEAEEIARQISDKKAAHLSLRTAILDFVQIADGPTIQPIVSEKDRAERILSRLFARSDVELTTIARRLGRGADPETASPRLREATTALQSQEASLRSTIESCKVKLQEAYKIIQSRSKPAEATESNAATPKADAEIAEKAVV